MAPSVRYPSDIRAMAAASRVTPSPGASGTGSTPPRGDQWPYGGVKASGVGREGLRYAMEDFTYERVLVLTGLTL